MNAYEDWEKAKKALSLVLPKSTFNAWLLSSRGVEWSRDGNEIIVEVINGYAVDWLNSRLMGTIEKLFSEIEERSLTVKFVAETSATLATLATLATSQEEVPAQTMPALLFDGFEQLRSNYSQIPNELIDNILPYVKPTVCILVLMVFRHTIGTIISKSDRQHEWVTTNRIVCETCSLSQKSCKTSLEEAVNLNLILFREVTQPDQIKKARIKPRKGELVYALAPKWKHQQ